MRELFREHKQILFVILTFILAELFVNPIGDFPLNDDWAYAKALLIFKKTGEFNLDIFPAMTLCTQILWGFAFIKLFGFSFTVLRFSTLISALIGSIFLYRLVNLITRNKLLASVAAAVLLFNPIHFNLSNTYMTDVNFNTLLIICCFLIHSFFVSGKKVLLIAIFVASAALVLLRQFGIVLPFCFFASCFFMKQKKWLFVSLSLVLAALVMIVFKGYEGYLKRILPADAAYKFSNSYSLIDKSFRNFLYSSFTDRALIMLMHALIYIFPLALAFIPGLVKKSGWIISFAAALAAGILSFICFRNTNFPFQNILTNMQLGPSTFYESFKGAQQNVSASFGTIMLAVKYIFSGGTLFVAILALTHIIRSGKFIKLFNPQIVFITSLFSGYAFMLFASNSYFDRYHIPFITLGLLALAHLSVSYRPRVQWSYVLLLLSAYMSQAGTRDYLELNRKRWEACNYLIRDLRVKHEKINGGYEVNCWLEESRWGYWTFQDLRGCDYLVQFNPEPGFRLLKSYEFQRYFPFKKDKINIFVRDQKQHL